MRRIIYPTMYRTTYCIAVSMLAGFSAWGDGSLADQARPYEDDVAVARTCEEHAAGAGSRAGPGEEHAAGAGPRAGPGDGAASRAGTGARPYSEYPARYSRVRSSLAATLLVTRMLAPS